MISCSIALKKFRITHQALWQWRAVCALMPLFLCQNSSAIGTKELMELSLEQLLRLPVTGSHITGATPAGSVTVISREMIQQSGVISVEALLQRLPVSAGYAGNQANAYWGIHGNGSTHVNLRGLGINRTLVLLNGRRLAHGGTGANAAVDLNSLPLAIIERIEILRDGASAIYGADAVAGVVNIITRTDLVGGEANAHYGETFRHDGASRAADLSWGAQGEHVSLLLGLSHSSTDEINMADRAPCGLGEISGELVCFDSGNTIGGRALLADGQLVNFNQTLGGDGDDFAPYSARVHNFNVNPYLNAVNPIERTSLSGFGTFSINDQLKAIAEVIYSERHSDQLASPGTIGLNRPMTIAADHPTNPTGQDLLLQRRRLLEAGTRNFYQDVKSIQSVLGLNGQLESRWDWNVALSFRRNTAFDGSTNVANLDRVDQTLNTDQCSNAENAAIPCADYLGYGDLTPAVIDYLMMTTRDRGGNEQQGISANITGNAFELPAGGVAIATGIELRKDSGWRHPDPLTVLGVANTPREFPTEGDLTAQEAFVEFDIPLFKRRPWIETLDMHMAVRHSGYDRFDTVNNYKLGFNWLLKPEFALHSHYSTVFRAPNVPELFAGNFNQNLITKDPCHRWGDLPANSVVAQNCQAEGIAPDFQQTATSILTTLGGNPKLEPESGKIFTFGADWTPADDVQLGLSYFSMDIKDAINTVAGATKLAACYNSPGRTHPFCSSEDFTRNPLSGQINYLSVKEANSASEEMSGIDFSANYQWRYVGWTMSMQWDVSYLHEYELLSFQDATPVEFAGKVTSGRGSYAKLRSLAGLTVTRGAWLGAYSIQYIDSMEDLTAAEGSIGQQIPSVTYQNLLSQYTLSESLQVAFGVDNVFDRAQPFVRNWLDVNTDTMTYDVQGRRWYLKSTFRW